MKNNPNSLTEIEFLELFKAAFKGRDDVYPEHNINNNAYYPVCANRFKEGCQIKRKITSPCNGCPEKAHVPLSNAVLEKHIKGQHRIGVYPLLKDNTCWFIAADLDNHDDNEDKPSPDPLTDVKRFYDVCEVQDVPCYVLRSKSGKGMHAYFFFDEPVPAWKARLVTFALLGEADLLGETAEINSFDRLFPNQDALSGEGLGNLIAMPFHGGSARQGNTVFLDPESGFTKPCENQLAILSGLERISEARLDEIIKEWKLERKPQLALVPGKSIKEQAQGQIDRFLKCKFIQWCRDNQSEVSEPLWWDMITNVVAVRPGGPDLCHEFSKKYPQYDPRETGDKIMRALNNHQPHTCDEIRKNGFACKEACGVRAPAGLLSKGRKHGQESQGGVFQQFKNTLDDLSLKVKENPSKAILGALEDKSVIDGLVQLAKLDRGVYEAFYMNLEAAGAKVKDVRRLETAVTREIRKSKLRVVGSQDDHEGVKVSDILHGAPVGDDILLPSGWELSMGQGVQHVTWEPDGQGGSTKTNKLTCPSPVLITGRLGNIQNGNEEIKLTWFRDGKWKNEIVSRGSIASKAEITKLADKGLPVTSLTAGLLVAYLAEFEALNIEVLPVERVSGVMGWQGDMDSFLWGRQLITNPESDRATGIIFKGYDAGNDQIADGFHCKGSYDDWVKMVNRVFDYPLAISALYFSLVPPFLDILGAENFVADWANTTSTGKTTILKLAASCWGCPNENQGKTILHKWDSTKVWIERAASVLQGIPLLLDDTKTAGTGKNKDAAAHKISETIYSIASGHGRGRGSIGGLRETGSWRTVLLSTGEQPAVDFTNGDGGSRARTLEFWGNPFGKADEITAEVVNDINQIVHDHYGHAAPLLLKFVLDNKASWNDWKNRHRELQKIFHGRANGNPVLDRLGAHLATLATVMDVVHKALPGLRDDVDRAEIIEHLWKMVEPGSQEADRATAALEVAYGWAVSNQARFWHRHADRDGKINVPSNGWAGAWKPEPWEYIAFSSGALIDVLSEKGFEAKAIIQTWSDRGWLLACDGRGLTKQVRVNKERMNCYCIRRDILNDKLGIVADSDDDLESVCDT